MLATHPKLTSADSFRPAPARRSEQLSWRRPHMEAHLLLPEAGEALLDVPMSPELMNYYRERLAASEHEIVGLRERVETCETSQATQHKARWELHKRMEEITDLQKALSDSHVYLWDERERCQRLQAENDELKIQEVEDRRKIQHLLSMVEPVMQDVTYLRDGAPETMTLHAHARATTTSAPASRSVRAGGGVRGGVSGGGGTGGGGHAGAPARPAVPVMNPGEGPRVLRTVYLPNEKVDSLLLTIESLRAQLQQQEQLGRERVAALHEDRRLRIEEVRATAPWQWRHDHPLRLLGPAPSRALTVPPPPPPHRAPSTPLTGAAAACGRGGEATGGGVRGGAYAVAGEQVHQGLPRPQARRPPGAARGEGDHRGTAHRQQAGEGGDGQGEGGSHPRAAAAQQLRQGLERAVRRTLPAAGQRDGANPNPEPNPDPNLNPDPDPDPDPEQVTDTERTMGLLKDRHSGLQQALTMRVRELEEGSSRFKHKYRQLEERRRLEVEGFRSELDLLHRQLQGVEMRVFGKRTPLMELTDLESSQQGGGGAPSSSDGKTAVTRKALRAVSSRIAELAQAAP